MNIPVDGIVIQGSGIVTNEAAMTGESDELLKDSHENCRIRKLEVDEEHILSKKPIRKPKDVPSPILLSGT